MKAPQSKWLMKYSKPELIEMIAEHCRNQAQAYDDMKELRGHLERLQYLLDEERKRVIQFAPGSMVVRLRQLVKEQQKEILRLHAQIAPKCAA